MTKRTIVIRVISFLIFGIFVIVSGAGMAFSKPITLKLAAATTEKSVRWRAVKQALDNIEKKSQGRVKFVYFPGKTLVKSQTTFDSVLKGVCDISFVQPAFFPGRFPLSDVIAIEPAFVDNIRAGNNWAFIKSHLLHEWSEVKVLCLNAKGSDAMFMTKSPARTPGDLKGKRMFAIGHPAKYVAAAGGTPIRMSPLELYEALQKNIVDGACIGSGAAISIKLSEVCKYLIIPGFGNIYSLTIMRKKSYESLPSDIQKMFDELADTVPPVTGKLQDEQNQKAYNFHRSKGGEVIFLNNSERAAYLKTAMKVNEEWAKGLEAKGIPAKKVLAERYTFMKKFMPEIFQ